MKRSTLRLRPKRLRQPVQKIVGEPHAGQRLYDHLRRDQRFEYDIEKIALCRILFSSATHARTWTPIWRTFSKTSALRFQCSPRTLGKTKSYPKLSRQIEPTHHGELEHKYRGCPPIECCNGLYHLGWVSQQ